MIDLVVAGWKTTLQALRSTDLRVPYPDGYRFARAPGIELWGINGDCSHYDL